MTANANRRSIRSLMRKVRRGDKLNILTFATHERYEENLCKTGHEFYSLRYGKEWDTSYAEVPQNYHIIDTLPDYVDFDLVLSHTSCNRIEVVHDLLSGTHGSQTNRISIPILRHCHVLPDIRFDTKQEINAFQSIPVDQNSFISDFNKKAWGCDKGIVIEHGIDTEFWNYDKDAERKNTCLSVVNEWPSRDWCCGFNLWRETSGRLPVTVVGKCTGRNEGFSEAARDASHLRQIYQNSRIFYNTSIHSPVPTVLLEAMACGCAVVSTETCMIPEIIEHGKNGFISNNKNELRSFLELLLKDEDLAKKLGAEARKTICERYGLDPFIEKWNDLLYNTVENYTDTMEVSNESLS